MAKITPFKVKPFGESGGGTGQFGSRIRDELGKFVENSLNFNQLPIQKITENEAEKMLIERIFEFEKDINKTFKNIDKLNENQYAAFVSICYNCGISGIGSGLKNLIENDRNNIIAIEKIWLQYNKSNGKVLRGLTRRRQDEIALYKKEVFEKIDNKNPLMAEKINDKNTYQNVLHNQETEQKIDDKNTEKSTQNFLLPNKKNTKQETQNSTQTTFFNPMSSSILSSLTEKGIDIATSFIPGGSLVQSAVKSIAKSLLGRDDASEDEVKAAIANASPEDLEKVRLEIEKLDQEFKISEETTKQLEVKRELKGMDFLTNFIEILSSKKDAKYWFIAYLLYFHIALGITLWYCTKGEFANDDLMLLIHRAVLVIIVSAPIMPMALIFKPIYNIIEAMSKSITSIAEAPACGVFAVKEVGRRVIRVWR